jgi:hypothetical protein
MATLQEDQTPIDLDIVHALVESVPSDWRSAVLEAERVVEADGGTSHRLTIRNLQRLPEVVVPSAELMLGIRQLDLVFQKHEHPWSKVRYTITRAEDDGWDFVAQFEYPGA